MFKKKKIDTTLTEAKSADEATNYIFIGFKYFLFKKPIKTAIVILILMGGALYMVADYYSKYQFHKQRVERIK